QDGTLSLEECYNKLMAILKTTDHPTWQDGDLPPVLVTSLRDMQDRANNIESSKIVFEFAKRKQDERLVKIVSGDVPNGILPKFYTGKLHDTRVHSKVSDDAVYEKNPDIRNK
ncbi:unnamed protein product, partial [Meganyctiphanes norvegica]